MSGAFDKSLWHGPHGSRIPEVERIELIVVKVLRGSGELPDDPVREVRVYYTLDGAYMWDDDRWEVVDGR